MNDHRQSTEGNDEVWEMVKSFLRNNSGLEAKTLFEHLQRQYPGRFPDGQVRTFQRRVKNWLATAGPALEEDVSGRDMIHGITFTVEVLFAEKDW